MALGKNTWSFWAWPEGNPWPGARYASSLQSILNSVSRPPLSTQTFGVFEAILSADMASDTALKLRGGSSTAAAIVAGAAALWDSSGRVMWDGTPRR